MFIIKYIVIEFMVVEINWILENLNKEYGKIIVIKYVIVEIKWNEIVIKYVFCDYIICS